MGVPFERNIARFPAHFNHKKGEMVDAEPQLQGAPSAETTIFGNPQIARSAELSSQFIIEGVNSSNRNRIIQEAKNAFSDATSLSIFHGHIQDLRDSILHDPEQTTESKRRAERYQELIEKTSPRARQEIVIPRPVSRSETVVRDYTRIFDVPSVWLNQEQRDIFKRTKFSPRELAALQEAREHNERMMEEAEAIIIGLQIPPGFLGDGLQNSRLAEIIHQRYPDKTYLGTTHPSVFGKFRTSNHPIPKIRDGKVEITYRENSDAPEQTSRFDNVFVIDPSIDNLSSGALLTVNGIEQPVGLKDRIDLDKVEYNNILQVAQVTWELLFGGSIDSLPAPAIGISKAAQEKAKRVFTELSISDRLNIIIHPDTHALLWEQKKWRSDKWIDLVKRLSQQYGDASIFISEGVDHPGESEKIVDAHRGNQRVQPLPRLSLPEYVGLLSNFSSDNTLFIGLESMPGSHLAPSFGFKSIVLSDTTAYFRYYGPWGGIVVANDHPDVNNPKRRNIVWVSVDKVFEATSKATSQL